MDVLGIIVVPTVAFGLGLIGQGLGHAAYPHEYIVTAAGAGVGAVVTSMYLGRWGMTWETVYVFPALFGVILLGSLVRWITRYFAQPLYNVMITVGNVERLGHANAEPQPNRTESRIEYRSGRAEPKELEAA